MNIQLSDHFTYRKLFKFVLPSIGMMIFTSVYGVVDGLFVSDFVGKTPFAAINLIIPFTMILGAFGYNYGAGNHEELKNMFKKSLVVTVIAGGVLMLAALPFASPLSRIFVGYDAELLAMTERGFHMYAVSFLICGFSIFGSAFFYSFEQWCDFSGNLFFENHSVSSAGSIDFACILGNRRSMGSDCGCGGCVTFGNFNLFYSYAKEVSLYVMPDKCRGIVKCLCTFYIWW